MQILQILFLNVWSGVKLLHLQCIPPLNHKYFTDAASVFAEMKKALHSKSLPIKKKQYPLKKEERKVLKVRVRPMEWKGRTKNRGGKYIKVIMEEEPPRLLMQETDGYNDIILMAKEALWNNPQMKEGTFTLCHADGTRWPIEDFEKEHASLSEIKDVWKKTFFIGRRPIGSCTPKLYN